LHADGSEYNPGPSDAMFINAGATHPQPVWLDCLRPGGRLILPLTTDTGRGGMLKVKRESGGYAARFLSPVSVFHCTGSRNDELNRLLRRAFMRGAWRSVQSLRRDLHEPGGDCWLHAEGFCLSTLPLSPAA
jgi:protein-L-isoaspartate(D-aspartate) O-methyltransferase